MNSGEIRIAVVKFYIKSIAIIYYKKFKSPILIFMLYNFYIL